MQHNAAFYQGLHCKGKKDLKTEEYNILEYTIIIVSNPLVYKKNPLVYNGLNILNHGSINGVYNA